MATIIAVLSLFLLNRFYKYKTAHLLSARCKNVELDKEKNLEGLKLAYEPPQSYITDAKRIAESESMTEDELKEMNDRPAKLRASERAAEVFCCLFNRCVPLRFACEQIFEVCCWGFLDSFLS